ncbi:hypothetical protein ES677_07175 [Bizionia gelidisalsuginis]|uniref:DUF4097 domain-containing protein n=2 Tax=Bizionia TaxID=283785 RepID=A0A8H2QLU3_9FLAO|nr:MULTISPECIES: hypothetical protein [Bizionia]TYB76004.1 hypothetical protein ES676_06015 [Bizionia saleffrena]TYC13507.1 hypothetical protein ES677_07175 [Bizionia gelidisalsuginis]
MKPVIILLFLFISLQLSAQKKVEETFSATAINNVVINGNYIFKIDLQTRRSNSIHLITKIEGEYTPEITVAHEIKDSTLYIGSVFRPSFALHNDKLSAHKVVSIEIVLEIPEGLKVYLKSDIGSAKIKGKYAFITAELSQGNCFLNNFIGSGLINTINGNVTIETNYAQVKAHTKYGTLTKESLIYGDNTIEINSINGDINLKKIEK